MHSSLLQGKQFEEADKILVSILHLYSDTDSAEEAKALQPECREGHAALLLSQAKEQTKQKRFDQAAKLLSQILEQYSDTSVAAEAKVILAACNESLAASRMSLAKPFIDRGDDAHASSRLKEIIRLYPQTRVAKDAEKALKKLGVP